MFKSKKLAVIAALLSVLMLLSMMAVPAFAEGTTAEVTKEEVTTATEAETKKDAETGKETEAATKEESSTDAKDEATKEEEEEAKEKQMIRGIVNLIVGAVILLVLGILAFKNRAKIPSWWKGLKSECGKITWCPKDKLKKNVLVVVVIILVIAVAIGVLDFVFSRGMIFLGDFSQLIGKQS